MAPNERARKNHDELFPGHVSTLAVTDPELIETFDNFAFDEVLRHSNLDARTRLMVQLASFDLPERYPETFRAEVLGMTDTAAIHELLERSFAELGRTEVIISNAGYGLFGAAEELTDKQVEHIVAINLVGPIQLIHAALPHLRAQGGGRVIQISSYGGQVVFPGNSMYHATKWGIEGYVESVAQEVASFGTGTTIVEPGGARTEFRYGSAQVAELMPIYDETPAHSFLQMLDPQKGLPPR